MKHRITIVIICAFVFISVFIIIYFNIIKDEFSLYRNNYPPFCINEEADLFLAHVDENNLLQITRWTDWDGPYIIPDEEKQLLNIWHPELIDIDESRLYLATSQEPQTTNEYLSRDDIITLLNDAAERNLQLSVTEIVTEEQDYSTNRITTIFFEGMYRGKITLVSRHGEHQVYIPLSMTNIPDIVKPDLFYPRAVAVSAIIALMPVTAFLLFTNGQIQKTGKRDIIISLIILSVFLVACYLVYLYIKRTR